VFVVRPAVDDKGAPVMGADGQPAQKAHRTPVKLGFEHDQEVVIASGVAAGDRVVVAGQLKLQDGGAVTIAAPAASDDAR
jgi:hypothetical protein